MRILIVTVHFPPSRAIAARRAERLATGLARRGWEVTVLTLLPRYLPAIDDVDGCAGGVEVVRTHAFLPRTLARRLRDLLTARQPASADATWHPVRSSRTWHDHLMTALRSVEVPDKWRGWHPFAELAVRGRRFDVVLATIPPYTPALVARSIARRRGGALVLDYRDPWCEIHEGVWSRRNMAAQRRIEDACLSDARLVLGATPTICEMHEMRSPGRVAFVPNAFEPAGPPPATYDHLLTYAGSLSHGRSLMPALQAMSRLPGATLAYAGAHAAALARDAAAAAVKDRVMCRGEISTTEALHLTRSGAAAVVVVSRRFSYAYPGKIFDILAAQRPILLIAPDTADATELIRRHRLGWSHEPSDVDGIASTLERIAAGEIPIPVDLDELRTGPVVDKVDALLRGLCC